MHGIALKYFIAVAQTGSFTKAAEKTHVAVSAISRQIALLEQETGVSLFRRLPRGVELTEEGEIFLTYAQRVALDTHSVLQEMQSLQKKASFEIRLGASEGLAHHTMPLCIAKFAKLYPDVQFSLQTLSPSVAIKKIKDGSIDLSLNYTIDRSKGTAIKKTWRAPVYVLMAKDHPLSKVAAIRLEDIMTYPLALTEEDSTAHSLLKRSHALSGLNKPLHVALRSNYSQALIKYVANTHALTLSGFLSISWRLMQDELTLKPLAISDFDSRVLHLQCMLGRLLPDPIQHFVDMLIETVDQQLKEDWIKND